MSMVGMGMVMKSLPFFPISSPCGMYFLRLRLMRPRTMSRKRAWSCLILRVMDPADLSLRSR